MRPTSPTPSRGIPQVRRGISAERVRFYPMPTVRSGCASGDYAHAPWRRGRGEEVCLPVGEVHVRPPVVVLALAGIPVGDPPGLEPERAFEAGYGRWQVDAHNVTAWSRPTVPAVSHPLHQYSPVSGSVGLKTSGERRGFFLHLGQRVRGSSFTSEGLMLPPPWRWVPQPQGFPTSARSA